MSQSNALINPIDQRASDQSAPLGEGPSPAERASARDRAAGAGGPGRGKIGEAESHGGVAPAFCPTQSSEFFQLSKPPRLHSTPDNPWPRANP